MMEKLCVGPEEWMARREQPMPAVRKKWVAYFKITGNEIP